MSNTYAPEGINNVMSDSAKLANMSTTQEIIIQGLTRGGKTFRPSDWAERISSVLSTYGKDHRMSYSLYVKPVTIDGVKCVVINPKLEATDPRALSFLLTFARENDLQVIDKRTPASASP